MRLIIRAQVVLLGWGGRDSDSSIQKKTQEYPKDQILRVWKSHDKNTNCLQDTVAGTLPRQPEAEPCSM